MTIDKAKLKALAEAANAVTTDVNITMAAGADPVEVKAVQDYLQLAMPTTILALLSEIKAIDSDRKACWAEFKVQTRMLSEAKSENHKMVSLLSEISRTSGDNWAVIAARNLLKEIGRD